MGCMLTQSRQRHLTDLTFRKFNDRHEWKLDANIIRELSNIFGNPCIASWLNNQIPKFCSWKPHPETSNCDVLSINWAQFEFEYIFLQFSLITRCLQKLHAERVRGWRVVPFCPFRPWIGALLRIFVKALRLNMRQKDVRKLPMSTEDHPVM